ncbi:tetratricopeptide repeat protein [Kaarinaea lacus]
MISLTRHLILIVITTTAWGCSVLQSPKAPSGDDAESHPAGDSQQRPVADVIREFEQEHASDQTLQEQQPKSDLPPSIFYQLTLAEIAAQRGQMDIAIANYVDAAKKTQDPKVAERATQMSVYAQDMANALSSSALWVEVDGENPESHRTRAAILLKIGRAADAVAEYEKMIELMPGEEARAYNIIVSHLSREPDHSVSLAVMERLVESRPDNAQVLFAYAHLAMRHAKFDTALVTLDKVLALEPSWADAVILRARIMAMQGDRDAALAYLKGSLKGDLANDFNVRNSYARMLTEVRQFEAALDQFKILAKQEPTSGETHYLAGILALQLKKNDLAEKYLIKVLEIGRQRTMEANYYLAQIAELDENMEEAIERYSMVRRGELYFNAQVRIVALLADAKEYDQARVHLQTINAVSEKQQVQLYLLEGDILREAKRYEDAKQFYTTILTRFPEQTNIRYARALIAEKLGDLQLVESDLLTILEVEPENAQVLNALGYTLADRTDRYQEALQYIQKALNLEPEDAAVMDSMGWVNYRLGNYEEALLHLRKANEMAKDPEIAAHLGEVLWVTGNKSDALKIWESSLKENPDHDVLLRVMKRFGL